MDIRQVVQEQISQARANQAEAAFNEDYVEAGVQSIRIEALEDVLIQFDAQHVYDNNVVNIHG